MAGAEKPKNECTILQAINQALGDAMEADESVVLLGEDIGDEEEGGVVGVTRGLSSRFGLLLFRSLGLSQLLLLDLALLHLLGLELHWMVLPMSVILLLAVGSDYNLLLVSRFKEELHGGLKTGIIRSMAGTGSVVTSAGLVFAFTMASFAFSDLKVMAQVGTTIALGLLFDTLVVRSFMTPAVAALLGKWFWWPKVIRTEASRRRLAGLSAAR